jgi:WD40 repeat protein
MNAQSRCRVRKLKSCSVALCAWMLMLGQPPGHAQVTADQPQMVLQLGHRGYITAAALSRDGRVFATGAIDKTVKLWDVQTGELKRTLPEHENAPSMIAFSPDSKRIVTADVHSGLVTVGPIPGRSARLRFWNADTGQLLYTVPCRNRVVKVSISPDWKMIAQAEESRPTYSDRIPGAVTLSDARTGTLLRTLPNANKQEPDLIFSPDGTLLAGWEDVSTWIIGVPWRNPIRLWDVRTGRLLRTLVSRDNIEEATFAPDGKTLVSIGFREAKAQNDRHIYRMQVWDVRSGKLLRTLTNVPEGARTLVFAPDGKTLASSHYRQVTLWNTQTWKPRHTLRQAGSYMMATAFTRDKNKIIGCGWLNHYDAAAGLSNDSEFVRLWDVSTGKVQWTSVMGRGDAERLLSVRLLAGGKTLVGEESSGTIRLWDARTLQVRRTFRATALEGRPIALSPDGKLLIRSVRVKPFQSVWRVWNTETGRLRRTIPVPGGGFVGPAGGYFSHDDRKLVVTISSDAIGDGGAALWDLETGKVAGLEEQRSLVLSVAFSPDDTMVAFGTFDRSVTLWNAQSGQLLGRLLHYKGRVSSEIKRRANVESAHLLNHKGRVSAVEFAPDGIVVASGDATGELRLWNSRTRTLKRTWKGHLGQVLSLRFSSDGKRLVSSSEDGAVKVWDAVTGKLQQAFTEQVGSSPTAFLMPDGKTLVISRLDGIMTFWNVETRYRVLTLQTLASSTGRLGPIDWIAYTPEGYYMGSPGIGRFIRWRADGKLFPAERYEKKYHHPDVVQTTLSGRSD